jgi:hypothetical protein
MTATILQAAGTLLLVVAAALLHPAAGFAVAGLGLLAFGLAWERNG